MRWKYVVNCHLLVFLPLSITQSAKEKKHTPPHTLVLTMLLSITQVPRTCKGNTHLRIKCSCSSPLYLCQSFKHGQKTHDIRQNSHDLTFRSFEFYHVILIDCIKFASGTSTKFELYILGNGHVYVYLNIGQNVDITSLLKATTSSTLFGISLMLATLVDFIKVGAMNFVLGSSFLTLLLSN